MTAASASTPQSAEWGTRIETAEYGGVRYRVYADRPRDVADMLSYASRWGDRPHIVQGDRVVTFAELTAAVAAKADELARLRLRRGDLAMVLGFNSIEWVVNFWAIVSVGAVPVLANAWWSSEELGEALDLLKPAVVLADGRAVGRLPAGCPTAPWGASGATGATAASAAGDRRHGDENDAAAVIFTSGTSGRPKAVLLAHRSLLAGLHMLLHVTKRLPHQVTEAHGSTALHTGPMFHIGGIQTLLRAVIVGDTLVMPRGKFDPAEALELIETWKVARWSAVPTMVSRVLEHPDVRTRDVTTLRSLTVGGTPIHGEFLATLKSGFPGVEPRVATGYGLTENGGQATAASGQDTADRPGCSGRVLPCVELRTESVADYEDGEILVRSPTQMLGYFGTDESPVDAEGWLRTGDLGRIDEDGFLWITGRSKDMIIRGGENISPASVEGALNALPTVTESVVFGVPDKDLGEEVMAVVAVNSDESPESLRAQIGPRLASFALPSRWELVRGTLPVNHAGKIDKPSIAAAARARLADDAAGASAGAESRQAGS
jgi:acyl-CoA synthetase (AMP-forming)/AMP-acid ligase II